MRYNSFIYCSDDIIKAAYNNGRAFLINDDSTQYTIDYVRAGVYAITTPSGENITADLDTISSILMYLLTTDDDI